MTSRCNLCDGPKVQFPETTCAPCTVVLHESRENLPSTHTTSISDYNAFHRERRLREFREDFIGKFQKKQASPHVTQSSNVLGYSDDTKFNDMLRSTSARRRVNKTQKEQPPVKKSGYVLGSSSHHTFSSFKVISLDDLPRLGPQGVPPEKKDLVGNNYGARSVLKQLDNKGLDLSTSIQNKLRALDICQDKIWCVYKDMCREDIDYFIKTVKDFDTRPIECPRGCQW